MRVTTLGTPFGRVEVCEEGDKVRGVVLADDLDFDEGDARPPESSLARDLQRYFSGEPVDFGAYQLDLEGYTPFEVKVLHTVREIPYGSTRTYDEIAEELGKPHHGRVIEYTLHKNRTNILVPSHRVVQGPDEPGEFASGRAWKEALLRLEGALPKEGAESP